MVANVPHWFTPIRARWRKHKPTRQPYKPVHYRPLLSKLGHRVIIAGRTLKLYGIGDLATIYQVPYSTVSGWYIRSVLPEPFLVHESEKRSRPMYTMGQIRAICRVLNWAFTQGITQLNKGRTCRPFIEMMWRGADLNLRAFKQEIEIHASGRDMRRHGVEIIHEGDVSWIDPPACKRPRGFSDIRKVTREDMHFGLDDKAS